MTNLTEEDVKFICEFLLAPLSAEVADAIENYDKTNAEVLERLCDGLIKQIEKIRYEQERDRRFYKELLTRLFRANGLFYSVSYDDLYKDWCAEFDKLHKEKKDE